MNTASPLVSCLLVTLAGARRMAMLKHSIASYIAQTYKERELVVIVDNQDPGERQQLVAYLKSLDRADIRCIIPERKLSLGALRNLSMEKAAGAVLCQWDDDDLSHPNRLETQLHYLIDNNFDAVLLTDHMHIFPKQGICYWEKWRNWIGGMPSTLMVKKGHGIKYPESGAQSAREEDLNFVVQLKNRHRLGYCTAPAYYYLYYFHGENTWDFAHHRQMAMNMAIPKEVLENGSRELIKGMLEVPGFELARLTFSEKFGPLFTWTREGHVIAPAPEVALYRSRSLMMIPWASGKCLLHQPARSLLVEMATPKAECLASLLDFKSLDEHALDICVSQRAEPAVIRRFLEEAAERGFLVSDRELKSAMLAHAETETPAISSAGFIAGDNPEQLERCVTSFLDNFRAHGRTPRIRVVSQSDANEACVAALQKTYPECEFHYAGAAEIKSYAETLGLHAGVETEVVGFALLGTEYPGKGSARNALLLASAGECVLSVDEEVTCRLSASPDARDGLRITSREDNASVCLFADRDALLEASPAQERDLLALHEEMLGKSPGAALKALLTFDHVTAILIDKLEKRSSTIRISHMGIYGDSGTADASEYLWRDEHVLEQLTTNEETYRRLSASREIFRAARSPSITEADYGARDVTAFDNRSILPPFMPCFTGEESVFAGSLKGCFGSALTGMLPWALLNAPETKQGTDIRASAQSTPFAHILRALIGTFPPSEFERDARESLRNLGRHLCALGQLPPEEFERVLCTSMWPELARRIETVRRQQVINPGAPAWWVADIQAHLESQNANLTPAALLQSLLRNECAGKSAKERAALAQRLTLRFGQVLIAWPALMQAAAELNTRGITLTRVLQPSKAYARKA